MKVFARGAAVLLTSAVALCGTAMAAPPTTATKDKTVLTTEIEKASYMVGVDVAQSIAPVAPDLDVAAFGRAIRNAFDGGKPLLTEAEAKPVAEALMKRVAARTGQAPADGALPEVAKDKVGYLVGSDVGRSLVAIKDELELPVLVQAVRTALAKGAPLLGQEELNSVRQAFSQKIQAKMQAKASAAAEVNRTEGAAFLVANKAVKGVFTTGSGLQYMVLRQGAGLRPKPTDKVRVNYEGTTLDGKVFDSSYERGQPAEFGLNQVIAGWTEGVSMMPVGGKFRFWIPGELAYGPKGAGEMIGPNATLVFDVELLDIL